MADDGASSQDSDQGVELPSWFGRVVIAFFTFALIAGFLGLLLGELHVRRILQALVGALSFTFFFATGIWLIWRASQIPMGIQKAVFFIVGGFFAAITTIGALFQILG